MRVVVTGASGHIASAVIPELVSHGHDVVGLVRSDSSAAAVEAMGAEALRGELSDTATLTAAADRADAVIHLAYDHSLLNTGRFAEAQNVDRAALEALTAPLVGTGKAFVGTSATLTLATSGLTGRPGTEVDVMASGMRVDSENYVIDLAERGVRSSVVRVPPLVHSDLDHHGYTPTLIGFAREHGAAAYVGDGTNSWAAVDTHDLGALFRLAAERAPAGTRLHGVADGAIAFRTVAETIAGRLGVPAVGVSGDDAGRYLGYLARFAQLDGPVSSELTREAVGWQPTRPSWVEDVRSGRYDA